MTRLPTIPTSHFFHRAKPFVIGMVCLALAGCGQPAPIMVNPREFRAPDPFHASDSVERNSVRAWAKIRGLVPNTTSRPASAPGFENRGQRRVSRLNYYKPGETITEDKVLRGLKIADIYTRYNSCLFAGRMALTSAEPSLTAMLGPGKPLAAVAAWALGEIHTPSAVKTLINELKRMNAADNDPDPIYHAALADALGNAGAKRAIPILLDMITLTPSADLISRACMALYRIGTPDQHVKKKLKAMLDKQDIPGAARLDAALVLCRMGAPKTAQAEFQRAWESAGNYDRKKILSGAMYLDESDATGWLISGLTDPDPMVWAAAMQLGTSSPYRAFDKMLLQIYDYRSGPVRTRAAIVLALRGWDVDASLVYSVIATESGRLTVLGLKAALTTGHTEWYPEIIALLGSDTPTIREAAAWTLAYMNIRDALEPILDAAQLGSNYTRNELYSAYDYLKSRLETRHAANANTPSGAEPPTASSNTPAPGRRHADSDINRLAPVTSTDFMKNARLIEPVKVDGVVRGAIIAVPGKKPALFMIGEYVGVGYVLKSVGQVRLNAIMGTVPAGKPASALMAVLTGPDATVYLAEDGSTRYVPNAPAKR